jgi:hypothetical protein
MFLLRSDGNKFGVVILFFQAFGIVSGRNTVLQNDVYCVYPSPSAVTFEYVDRI